MAEVENLSMVNQEIVVSKGKGERKTEQLKPGEKRNLSINTDDMHMRAAIFAGAIRVSGEEKLAEQPLEADEIATPKTSRK